MVRLWLKKAEQALVGVAIAVLFCGVSTIDAQELPEGQLITGVRIDHQANLVSGYPILSSQDFVTYKPTIVNKLRALSWRPEFEGALHDVSVTGKTIRIAMRLGGQLDYGEEYTYDASGFLLSIVTTTNGFTREFTEISVEPHKDGYVRLHMMEYLRSGGMLIRRAMISYLYRPERATLPYKAHHAWYKAPHVLERGHWRRFVEQNRRMMELLYGYKGTVMGIWHEDGVDGDIAFAVTLSQRFITIREHDIRLEYMIYSGGRLILTTEARKALFGMLRLSGQRLILRIPDERGDRDLAVERLCGPDEIGIAYWVNESLGEIFECR